MMSPEEAEEQDREIRERCIFSLRILIIHPDMDPSILTKALAITPNLTKTAGQPRRTGAGRRLPGRYPDSIWSYWEEHGRESNFEPRLGALVDRLAPASDFLRTFLPTCSYA